MNDLAGLGKVGVRLIETGEKFLERWLGPWVDVKGQQLADKARAKRRKNMAIIAGETSRIVGDAELREIPGRILFPFLDAAPNEEEPELQGRWAALLANALSDGPRNKILPAYIEILRQLTPTHAHIVDWMYDNAFNMGRGPDDLLWYDQKRPEIQTALSLSHADFALLMADLDRMKLITTWRPPVWAGDDEDKTTQYNVVQITALTIGFVRACRPPDNSGEDRE